ncbi:Methylenetetrahydrofolate--tRNA-(uracil-5-)-methyltransferase TrmFO [bioreactor metagenome]|uniref:Methylenetetrahydrofolate--tRNA-(Uracil-5-)-methyltransferase TrmFO n=1 Tax=bioreactor metagenome TaxID=1076179 RepID=A0A645F371_9ZZZZ
MEGYVESAASGLLAGINMTLYLKEQELMILPDTTMIGAMANYITHADSRNFQPMNANFGIMRLLSAGDKKTRKEAYSEQSEQVLTEYLKRWKNI